MFNLRAIYLKWKWKEVRKEAKDRIELREYIRKKLLTPMTPEEIRAYNINLIIESSGWLGGDHKDRDIKYRMWFRNQDLFKGKKFEDVARFS